MVGNHSSDTQNRKGARSQKAGCVSLSEVGIVFVQEFVPAVEYYSQGYYSAYTYEEVLLHFNCCQDFFSRYVLEGALENAISHLHAFQRIKKILFF